MEQEKLYSPLEFFLRDKYEAAEGQYDDIHYWRDELPHEEAFGYLSEIKAALADERKRYDNGRGLMEYFGEGPLDSKVQSLIPHIELHGDKLWTVADVRLNEPLTPLEMADLKSWWGGQLSDGWGEGFEQHEIKVDRGDLYVEPWTASSGFFIATQAEFDRRMRIESAHQAADLRDDLLTQIAKKHCRVETLETRRRDSLDFHDISVWGLKAALQEAFEAGAAHQMQKHAAMDRSSALASDKPSLLAGLREAKAKADQQKSTLTTNKSEPEL